MQLNQNADYRLKCSLKSFINLNYNLIIGSKKVLVLTVLTDFRIRQQKKEIDPSGLTNIATSMLLRAISNVTLFK